MSGSVPRWRGDERDDEGPSEGMREGGGEHGGGACGDDWRRC